MNDEKHDTRTCRDILTYRDILGVVLREMTAIGAGWRMDWSGFDGRTLRNQLDALDDWAKACLRGEDRPEYKRGTEFYERMVGGEG